MIKAIQLLDLDLNDDQLDLKLHKAWPDDYEDTTEYLAGLRACWSGRVVLAGNPHKQGTLSAALWEKGYNDADDSFDIDSLD